MKAWLFNGHIKWHSGKQVYYIIDGTFYSRKECLLGWMVLE